MEISVFFSSKNMFAKNIVHSFLMIFFKNRLVRGENHSETHKTHILQCNVNNHSHTTTWKETMIVEELWSSPKKQERSLLFGHFLHRAVVVRTLQMGFRGKPLLGDSMTILLNAEFRQKTQGPRPTCNSSHYFLSISAAFKPGTRS